MKRCGYYLLAFLIAVAFAAGAKMSQMQESEMHRDPITVQAEPDHLESECDPEGTMPEVAYTYRDKKKITEP